MCFTGMQISKPKEKPPINPGSTTVFPHRIKGMHKLTLTKSFSICLFSDQFVFVISFHLYVFCIAPFFMTTFFRITWTGSFSHSAYYRHVNHFHHGYCHCSHHHVLYLEGQAGWPWWVKRKNRFAQFNI